MATERDSLEEKLGHLSKSAQRYSRYDPKYVRLHEQIDEALDAWQFACAVVDDVVVE